MRGGQFKYDPNTKSPISPTPWLLGIGGLAHAAVERVVEVDYVGDGTDNREVSLGLPCNFTIVAARGAQAFTTNRIALAYAISTMFGIFIHLAGTTRYASNGDSDCTELWQGLVGGTSPNIKLGSDGSQLQGTNVNTELFRIIGFKFRDYP